MIVIGPQNFPQVPKIAYVGGFLPFFDPLHTIKTFSTKCPQDFLQDCPQHFPQEFPARFSRKNFPQEFPARISRKNFPQDFPARISRKIFPLRFSLQDFPASFNL